MRDHKAEKIRDLKAELAESKKRVESLESLDRAFNAGYDAAQNGVEFKDVPQHITGDEHLPDPEHWQMGWLWFHKDEVSLLLSASRQVRPPLILKADV